MNNEIVRHNLRLTDRGWTDVNGTVVAAGHLRPVAAFRHKCRDIHPDSNYTQVLVAFADEDEGDHGAALCPACRTWVEVNAGMTIGRTADGETRLSYAPRIIT